MSRKGNATEVTMTDIDDIYASMFRKIEKENKRRSSG